MIWGLKDAVPVSEVRRALVIKLRHHGDVLLSSPVFTALKAAAPGAEIDALVYADTAEMLTLHPAISRVLCVDRKWKQMGLKNQVAGEYRLYRDLRARHYDLIVDLTEHWRGAWLSRFLKPRCSVGPVVGGRGSLWKQSFTHLYSQPRNALRHVVEANLDALRRIGIQPPLDQRKLTLLAGDNAESAVAEHLDRLGLLGRSFIHIHPASRWFFKCWPVERMAGLIRRLRANGHVVVLTGAPTSAEQAMVDAIQALLDEPVASLAGQLSLKELAALCRRAQLFIGVDSAPMHIAAAVGTPVVALFGPSGDKQWGPWGKTVRVVASQAHSCRPCGIDGCGAGKVSDCLTSVTEEIVFASVSKLLSGRDLSVPDN